MSGKRFAGAAPGHAGLVSVDDSIDDIAAKALQAAREAEEKAKRNKEAGADKVKKPSSSPQTRPTAEKKPRK